MKLLVSLLFIIAALPLCAQDKVYLKNGQTGEGEILSIGDQGIRFKVVSSISSGQENSRVHNVPFTGIDYIQFAPLPGESDALANVKQTPPDQLLKIWDQTKERMHIPRSNAGVIGLNYAEKLLKTGDKPKIQEALEIFRFIEEKDWPKARRSSARRGRLSAMIGLGEEKQAMAEARKLAEQSEDPVMLIEAQYLIATVAFDRLRELEEENPKWMDDDEVRPVRYQHYNEALDMFLMPYLFYGSEEGLAARGLWHATQVHHFAKDSQRARNCAEDIIKLYPGTSFRAHAEALIQQLSNDTTSPKP